MDQRPPALDYASPPARTKYSPILYWLVVADCVILVLVLSLLHYPSGAGGSFFATEAFFAVPIALTASVTGLIYGIVLALKRRHVGLVITTLLLSIIPIPMFWIGYHIIDSIKHFNFGPG